MIKGVLNLKYGEILSILGQLYRDGETGTLLCQSGATAKYIYFQGGQILFAASNSLEDKFTQILLEEGKLKEEQIDMAMAKKGSKTIAKALTELGYISSADLIESLIKQVYRIVTSLLKWEKGTATFKPDSLPQGVAKLPLSTPRLILDVALAVDNRHYIMQILGGIDKVILINKAEMDVVLGLPLNPEEIQIVKSTDGIRTIENIATISQSNAFTTAKFFLGLNCIGLAQTKKIVETVNAEENVLKVNQEEKKVDLSFLDKALPSSEENDEVKFEVSAETKKEERPFQSIVPESETFKPITMEEKGVDSSPSQETTIEMKEEEASPPSLFSENFLPAEEKREEESFFEIPEIHLPPPHSMPKRRKKKTKMIITSFGILFGIVAITLGFLYLFSENGKELNPPPPSLPKVPSVTKTVKTEQEQGKKQQEQILDSKAQIGKSLDKEKPISNENVKEEEKQSEKLVVKEEIKKEEIKETKIQNKKEKETQEFVQDSYESLLKGDYDQAAEGFKTIYSSKKGGFTIAIMLACERDSIAKALAESNNSRELIIFPYNFKGRNCFRVIWGYYIKREEAENAFKTLPSVFKDSGAKVVSFEKMI